MLISYFVNCNIYMLHIFLYLPKFRGSDNKSKGVNWVEHLPNYMRVLNDLAREELGWRSPFETYYRRVSNFIKKDNIENNGIIH